MKRHIILFYGFIGYFIGLGVLSYMVVWVYPLSILPSNIDSGKDSNIYLAIIIDICLILAFGLQHSLMVRPRFKVWIEHHIHKEAIRTTYTIISSFFLALILIEWRPINITIWSLSENTIAWWIITTFYILGWIVAVISTFEIDHFELFGLRQVWRSWSNTPEPKSTFQESGFYRFIRHPIQAGTLMGIWATPIMDLGHLIFSISFSIYIFIGLYFEEQDLIKSLGEPYINYKKRVPMLMPFFKRIDSAK